MKAEAEMVRAPTGIGEFKDVMDFVIGEAFRLRGYSGGVRYESLDGENDCDLSCGRLRAGGEGRGLCSLGERGLVGDLSSLSGGGWS